MKTKIGNFSISLTDAAHAYIKNDDEIVVNGVSYSTVAFHVYRQPDGSWGLECESDPNGWHGLHMQRTDWTKTTSQSAKERVTKIVLEAWTEFVTDDMRIKAEIKRLHGLRSQAEIHVNELRKQLDAALNDLELTKIRLDEAKEGVNLQPILCRSWKS